MPGLNRPVVVEEVATSGLIRQRWIFSLQGHRLVLDRYSYERRYSKTQDFKVQKFYDRTWVPGENYGTWVWLREEEVPWDEDLKGEALARLAEYILVGRASDFGV